MAHMGTSDALLSHDVHIMAHMGTSDALLRDTGDKLAALVLTDGPVR